MTMIRYATALSTAALAWPAMAADMARRPAYLPPIIAT